MCMCRDAKTALHGVSSKRLQFHRTLDRVRSHVDTLHPRGLWDSLSASEVPLWRHLSDHSSAPASAHEAGRSAWSGYQCAQCLDRVCSVLAVRNALESTVLAPQSSRSSSRVPVALPGNYTHGANSQMVTPVVRVATKLRPVLVPCYEPFYIRNMAAS